MADKAWKAFERRLAKWFPGATRRGSDFRDAGGGGKSDLILPGWSVEAKLYKDVTFGVLRDAALQAEVNKLAPDDIPVAVVKRKFDEDRNSWVAVRFPAFIEFFGDPTQRGIKAWEVGYLWVKRPTYAQMEAELIDAEKLAGDEKIPVAIIHRNGETVNDALVIMHLSHFHEHFINNNVAIPVELPVTIPVL